MDSCWSFGGPDWLFLGVLLGFGLGAPFGLLAWFAWAPPRVRSTASGRERTVTLLVTGAALAWSIYVFAAGRPDAADASLVGVAVAAAVAMFDVVRRAHHASLQGVPLVGGMAAAYGVVRWSSLTVASVGVGVGVWSLVASFALGHSCASP